MARRNHDHTGKYFVDDYGD